MVMEVDSEVLEANSEVFAGLIADCKRGGGGATMEVENLGVFSDTIELMFEDDDCITKKLINVGVFRSIDILEVPISSPFDLCSFYLHSRVFRLTKLLILLRPVDKGVVLVLSLFSTSRFEYVIGLEKKFYQHRNLIKLE